jgi:hypothetical protein
LALLAGKLYDPATSVTKSTASLLAMTAFDTTNLRVTFTAPASGIVWVRVRVPVAGATTFPHLLLGVLDGATIRFRGSPMGNRAQSLATTALTQEVSGPVTGLTPGNSYTWDAAYAVQVVIASTNVVYGGANDTAGNDAWGGAVFEVWNCPNLLGGAAYDPAGAVTKATTSLLAMTAVDTTNLRLTFTAPASGNVMWRIRCQTRGTTTAGQILLGILESSTVVARQAPIQAQTDTFAASSAVPWEASGVITGVSGGSHTYDAAYAVQVVGGSTTPIRYGGADNNSGANADGAFIFELWAA